MVSVNLLRTEYLLSDIKKTPTPRLLQKEMSARSRSGRNRHIPNSIIEIKICV